MRFSIVAAVILPLAAGVHSAKPSKSPKPPKPISEDVKTTTSVLENLKDGFEALATAADEFQGEATALKSAAASLLDSLEEDIRKLRKVKPLGALECLPLLQPCMALEERGDVLAGVLKSRRPEIEEHNLCATVEGFLTRGVDDSVQLMSLIKTKLPSLLQVAVQVSGSKTLATMRGLRDYFTEENCVSKDKQGGSCEPRSPFPVAAKEICLPA